MLTFMPPTDRRWYSQNATNWVWQATRLLSPRSRNPGITQGSHRREYAAHGRAFMREVSETIYGRCTTFSVLGYPAATGGNMRHGFVILGASTNLEGGPEHVQSLIRSRRVVDAVALGDRDVPLEPFAAEPARTG
jgi:hypothetical protein